MTRKPRHKTPAIAVPVPQSREAAAQAVAEIGALSRDLGRIEHDMNDELAAIKEGYEEEAEPRRQRIAALTEGVQTWAEANRDSLTQNGKTKTATLTTGELQWRLRPPSVRVTGADAVLTALRRFGLGRFIRAKEEVNKEAILNEPEAVAHVPGITISQGEDFVVTPFEAELAGVA
jgi:phage host-nuclease inhibitor protein Gam